MIYLPNKETIEKLENYPISLVKTIDNFVNLYNGICYPKLKVPIYWDSAMISEALINLESGQSISRLNHKSIPIVIYEKLSNAYHSVKSKIYNSK